MDSKIINIIKDRPVIVPKLLLNNYKELGITSDELIIIMVIMSYGDKVVYDPEKFREDINWDKRDVMKTINSLIDKNILSLIIEKSNRKAIEYISLEILYDKLFNIVIDNDSEKEVDNSIFGIFEGELGRMLTPMEYEKIKEWINNDNSNELIILALKEAVLKGVNNLNYIDSILNSWKKKGYKNKKDVEKEKKEYRNKKEKVEIFDTDWLNE